MLVKLSHVKDMETEKIGNLYFIASVVNDKTTSMSGLSIFFQCGNEKEIKYVGSLLLFDREKDYVLNSKNSFTIRDLGYILTTLTHSMSIFELKGAHFIGDGKHTYMCEAHEYVYLDEVSLHSNDYAMALAIKLAIKNPARNCELCTSIIPQGEPIFEYVRE